MEKAFRISSGQCACARAYVHVAIAEMWSEFQARVSCIMEACAAFVVTILRETVKENIMVHLAVK